MATTYLIDFSCDSQVQQVETSGEVTVLDALAGAGLAVRKACTNGVCGLCRVRLLSGEITYHWRQPHGLWERDLQEGYILPCIAYAVSDLSLDELPLETK